MRRSLSIEDSQHFLKIGTAISYMLEERNRDRSIMQERIPNEMKKRWFFQRYARDLGTGRLCVMRGSRIRDRSIMREGRIRDRLIMREFKLISRKSFCKFLKFERKPDETDCKKRCNGRLRAFCPMVNT